MGDSTDKLASFASKISNNPNSRDYDMLLSSGEQVSISLLSMILNEKGILIIDDFLLDLEYRRKDFDEKFYNEVMGGVFIFLKKNLDYKYLYTGHQLILKKN